MKLSPWGEGDDSPPETLLRTPDTLLRTPETLLRTPETLLPTPPPPLGRLPGSVRAGDAGGQASYHRCSLARASAGERGELRAQYCRRRRPLFIGRQEAGVRDRSRRMLR